MARILIIEDNQDIHAPELSSPWARNMNWSHPLPGQRGFAYCQFSRLGLVLLDYMLPGMNGQAVLEAIGPLAGAGHYARRPWGQAD